MSYCRSTSSLFMKLWSFLLCGTLAAASAIGPWSLPLRDLRHFHYVKLVASALWDWSPPLRATFVASVGCLRYVGPLLPQLVTFASTWDLCPPSWTPPLCGTWSPPLGIWVAPATWDLYCLCYVGPTPFPTLPLLCSSLPNRSSLRAHTCFAFR